MRKKVEVNKYTDRYIKIFTLFDHLFSMSLCSKMAKEIINKLKIVIKYILLCWRNLRLSTKIVKIYIIENHLLNFKKKTVKFILNPFFLYH